MTFQIDDLMVSVLPDTRAADAESDCTQCTRCTASTGDPTNCDPNDPTTGCDVSGTNDEGGTEEANNAGQIMACTDEDLDVEDLLTAQLDAALAARR